MRRLANLHHSGLASAPRNNQLLPLLLLAFWCQIGCPQKRVIEGFPYEFWGIGIELKVAQNQITVVRTIPGGPAHHLGIQSGDIIEAVDGTTVQTSEFANVIASLRGESKSQVKLTLLRKEQRIRVVVQRAFTRKTPNGYVFEE